MKVNLNNLTTFEKAIYDILHERNREFKSGAAETKAVTRYELATALKCRDRLIRNAISSMRKKGINVGTVEPFGYAILNAVEMRGNRAYLISYIKDLVDGVKGIERCIGIPDGQVSLEEVIND